MFNAIITNAVVSRGYDNTPAVQYSEKGSARFRFGKKVYDSRAEGNYRWVNMTVKAFGSLVERIQKMQLKEGSFINLMGRLDEDSWTDKNTGENRSAMVLILDEIEYASRRPRTRTSTRATRTSMLRTPRALLPPAGRNPAASRASSPSAAAPSLTSRKGGSTQLNRRN